MFGRDGVKGLSVSGFTGSFVEGIQKDRPSPRGEALDLVDAKVVILAELASIPANGGVAQRKPLLVKRDLVPAASSMWSRA